MKNWKTTVAGILGALAVWLPQLQSALESGHTVNWAAMGTGLAVLLIGVFAKDLNVTGGTNQQ